MFSKNALPNVLIIIAEDVNIEDYKCYNKNSEIPTPNVRQLAKNGIKFSNAHSTAALCAPARYSLLTGNYPNRQKGGNRGQWGFNVPTGLVDLNQQTIANFLKQKGYSTGLFGKTGIGGLHQTSQEGEIIWDKPMVDGPSKWGFEYSYVLPRGHQWLPLISFENEFLTCNPSTLIRGQQACDLANNHYNCPGSWNLQNSIGVDYIDPLFCTESIGETLLTKFELFLDQNSNKLPFFAYFCCDGSHLPWKPPKKIRSHPIKNQTSNFRNDMVYETDVLLGELIKILQKKNIFDDTLICFTSDHGARPFNIRHTILKGGKRTINEGGNRVPFILSYPKIFPKNKHSDDLISAMDYIPTVLDLVGVDIPISQCVDAKSLMPIIFPSESTRKHIRRSFLINHAKHWTQNAECINVNAIYYDQWKLIIHSESKTPLALYNLKNDVSESIDLIDDLNYKSVIDNLIALNKKLSESNNTRILNY